MTERIKYVSVAPGAMQAMYGLEGYIHKSGLEESLIHLVKLRASYINGCAFCVDMHTKDARDLGETEQRLYAVAVWHEAPFFTERERAAFAWTDALTQIAKTGAPDEVYEEVRSQFEEVELVNLTMVIVTINAWNRLAVGFRTKAGTYKAGGGG